MGDTQCKEEVWPAWSRVGHQCTRKAWKDGYCKQHHPDTVAARKKKKDERWDTKRKVTSLSYKIDSCCIQCIDYLRKLAVSDKKAAKLIAELDALTKVHQKAKNKLRSLK